MPFGVASPRSPPHGTLPAADLHARYRQRIAGQTLMVNELYLSLVYRPQPTAVGSMALALLRQSHRDNDRIALRDALDECAKKRQELMASLARYDPEPLGIYRGPSDRLFSSLLEFYGLLVNGEWQRLPLPRAPLNEVLATSRPFFGHEAMEYRGTLHTRLGAFLGIKEYPTPTAPGMFNALLTAPFPFVLTQSFTFLPKATAVDLMGKQYRRMRAADDLAISQAEELKDALDDLTSNRFVVGDHHFTLHVLADAFDGVKEAEGSARLRQLNDHIAQAWATPAWSWPARTWHWRPRSGPSCPATSATARASRRSPAATSRRWHRSTTFRVVARAATTGVTR